MTRSRILIFTICALIGLGGYAAKLTIDAGMFRQVTATTPGECSALPIMGPEDLAFLKRDNLVFISADNRTPGPDGTRASGSIFGVSLSGEGPAMASLTGFLPFPFHPHGLDVRPLADGSALVYVINHPEDATSTTVEQFLWKDGVLEHIGTLAAEGIHNANDLVFIDDTRFYMTHDHGATSELGKLIESYTRLGRGFVTYFDGQSFRRVAEKIAYANGLALMPDLSILFVASMTGLKVLRFGVDIGSGDLTPRGQIAIEGAPDNLHLSGTGSLWVAAHLNLFQLKAHSGSPNLPSASAVYEVTHPQADPSLVKVIFADEGSLISAASVAIPVGTRVIIGSIFGPTLLACDRAPQSTSVTAASPQ